MVLLLGVGGLTALVLTLVRRPALPLRGYEALEIIAFRRRGPLAPRSNPADSRSYARMRDQTEWWLNTARRDLSAARLLEDGGLFELAAFHCHQAAEKALKAYFVEQGQNERTHSSLELLSRLQQEGIKVDEPLFHRARKLDRSYIDSRYPSSVGSPDKLYDLSTVKELIQWAESVMAFVQSNLS